MSQFFSTHCQASSHNSVNRDTKQIKLHMFKDLYSATMPNSLHHGQKNLDLKKNKKKSIFNLNRIPHSP